MKMPFRTSRWLKKETIIEELPVDKLWNIWCFVHFVKVMLGRGIIFLFPNHLLAVLLAGSLCSHWMGQLTICKHSPYKCLRSISWTLQWGSPNGFILGFSNVILRKPPWCEFLTLLLWNLNNCRSLLIFYVSNDTISQYTYILMTSWWVTVTIFESPPSNFKLKLFNESKKSDK